MMSVMETGPSAVRPNVPRTRALLLDAADAVIRERGMELSLNAVAHQAGVGVGTVYRHFPDREALIDALFAKRVDRVCEVIAAHLDAEDPVQALRDAVFDICEMQAADRGVWEVASAGSREAHRGLVDERLVPLSRKLVRRANATGRLRMKFELNDLPVMLWTGGALNAYLGVVSTTAWRRYIQLMFDSFLYDDDPVRRPIEQKVLTVDQIDTAMRSWRPA